MQNKKDIIKGYALFLSGQFIASMGVAFSTKAAFAVGSIIKVYNKLFDKLTERKGEH